MAGVEERYQQLLEDPDVSKVEAHRVFCGRCEKWLKLDETKLYAASVWRCHKNTKSHNAKLSHASTSVTSPAKDIESDGPADQNSSISGSPSPTPKEEWEIPPTGSSPRHHPSADDVKEPIVDTVPAAVPAGVQPTLTRLKLKVPVPHPASSNADTQSSMPPPASPPPQCENAGQPTTTATHSGSAARPASPQNSVAGPCKSPLLADSKSVSGKGKAHLSASASAPKAPLPKELLPDRQASYGALLAEPLIEILEPFRAFCSLCRCWIELSSRTPYSYGIWKGHVRKSEKHIRLQTAQAENEYETASDNSRDEHVVHHNPENMGTAEHLARTNGANDCRPVSSPVPRAKSEGEAVHDASVQEVNGRAPSGAESATDAPSSPARIASSFGAQHASSPNGGIPTQDTGNPFALKATTEGSFGPRHNAEICDADGSQASEEEGLTIAEVLASKQKRSGVCSASEESVARGEPIEAQKKRKTNKGQHDSKQASKKLTPVKAMQRRRDGILADPEAAIVESRRVLCRMCERWIKGSSTQEYSSHHWLKHKNKCLRSKKRDNDRWSETAETRKQRLEEDPDLEKLEAHRALCKLCQKWVKLCSRSRYSASHWTQHKKKCPAILGGDSSIAHTEDAETSDTSAAARDKKVLEWNVEDRRAAFLADPDVLQVLPDRVQCKVCNRWIKLIEPLKYHNVNWLLHKECCLGDSADTESKQQSALEARKKVFEEDEDVAELEPHRVHCAVCESWVSLRHDISYSLGKWLLHRRRCGEQVRELMRGHSSTWFEVIVDKVRTSCCEDEDEDDAREAMDVENWLKHDMDAENSGDTSGLPQNLMASPTGGSGRVDGEQLEMSDVIEENNLDQDVEMDCVVDLPNSNPVHLDADDEANDEGKGKNAQPRVPAQQANDTKVSRKPNSAKCELQDAAHHHPTPSSRRRGRGRAPARPARGLFKGKGKAAPFMRGQAAMTLPPIPPRPRWPDEDERKQQFVSDPDVLRVEPHRLLCKNCNCWIRLHPIIRYSQSIWPRHKESCKDSLIFAAGDAKSRAKIEKEDARQRLLEDDPYATDVSPHRVTCKACGTNIRLDTTYKYEGSHWRAHRSRCTRIPFPERVAKKRKAPPEQVQEPVAVADFSDSDDSDASSAPRPRPTSFFTAPLIIKPMEMFKRRSHVPAPSPSKVAAAKAQYEAELTAELNRIAAELHEQGRFTTILQLYGDGVTSEERLARAKMAEKSAANCSEDSEDRDAPEALNLSPTLDSESWIPRKRTREEDEAFNAFFSQQPLPPTPVRPKVKMRVCKLGRDALQVVD